MSWTGQTITFMPFASVASRTVPRPGTAGAAALAAPASEPKLMKNEAKRFFMENQSGVQDSDNGYRDCPVQVCVRGPGQRADPFDIILCDIGRTLPSAHTVPVGVGRRRGAGVPSGHLGRGRRGG